MQDPIDETIDHLLTLRFATASEDARRLFRQAASVRRYQPGDVLCTQGQREEQFAIVVDGQLEIYMDQDRGRTFVATLDPGRSLGAPSCSRRKTGSSTGQPSTSPAPWAARSS